MSGRHSLCGGCKSKGRVLFFENRRTPADCGFAPFTREEALGATRASIRLSSCPSCGLIQNIDFDPRLIRFEPGYEVDLSHSPSFNDYQVSLAGRLIKEFGLLNKRILEIGCGGGAFLKLLCSEGANTGMGIDPTVPETGRQDTGKGTVEFVRKEFPALECLEFAPDFICSLSVMEDFTDVSSFLSSIHDLASTSGAPVYLEVFNGRGSLERGEVFSIHFEQCNYFSLASLHNVVAMAGFEITGAGHCYHGDQYIYVEARAMKGRESPPAAFSNDFIVNSLADEFEKQLRNLHGDIKRWSKDGRNVVIWGSGGKGISLLNNLNIASWIECVVDINPNRQGRFIPGTGHRIVAPVELKTIRPDIVIVTNRIYLSEIRESVGRLGIGEPEFVVA
ncbi:MAG: methyltransferase domain-containing protein [Planctomycetota bacterium]